MRTITIIEGVTLTATQSTIDTYLAEKAEAEWLENALAWLREPTNRVLYPEIYSDVYKDVHGIRPPLVRADVNFCLILFDVNSI